jgi:dienelactone hydrolase
VTGGSRPGRRRVGRRLWAWAAAALVGILLVAVVGFVLWANATPPPGPDALAALGSDEEVRVVEDDGYAFVPAEPAGTGLVLYPGARVDPASYAVAARHIAQAGYLVVVPEVTLNLAFLDRDAADGVMEDFPEVDRWVVGGHSLGGAMAADYAGDHGEEVAGLVLWAAYPGEDEDLSSLDVEVASVFGTRDGVTTPEEIDDSRDRLPADTNFVAIDGGNHAQFGDYGPQDGDNPATVSSEEQQSLAARATLEVLEAVG